jgi:pyruvate/2-oxoglutarate dehydrogenase complex dihydrolipoamide dehydrogenase (E3) component
MLEFDFAVIGGGSAGYAAASFAAKEGLRVVVVEGGEQLGGLCILRGCMPSKTLLATAARARDVRTSLALGVNATFGGVDGLAMQARKRLLIEDFAGYRSGQLNSGRFELLRGQATFVDPHTVLVRHKEGEELVHSKTFLISTGSVMTPAPVPGLDAMGYLDSDAMLESPHIPKSVTILGGGAIALEAATFYAGVGAEVTVLQRSSRILKDLDPDVSNALAEGLMAQGIRIFTGVGIHSCELDSHGKTVHFIKDGSLQKATSEEVVCALGRSPSTGGMALDKAGVHLDGARVVVGDTQQTSCPHIFAAGDVCGPLEVVHIAIQQGELAARNAVRFLRRSSQPMDQMDYRLKLFAVFSSPSVAVVGLSEKEASELGVPFLAASYPFGDHGKSMVEGHTQGFVKLVVHAETKRILGASVVGPEAAEIIHEVVVAMHFHATAGDLARVPHYHPTLSEIWTYPAEDLA